MPLLFGLLILALGFQFFFRYESWPSQTQDGVVYERDKLTGEVHAVAPGEKIDFMSRLSGRYGHPASEPSATVTVTARTDSDATGKKNSPDVLAAVPPTKKPASAQSAEPDIYQLNMMANTQPETGEKLSRVEDGGILEETALTPVESGRRVLNRVKAAQGSPRDISAHTVSRQLDFNNDGQPEQIIQSQGEDGLLNISVVDQGREVFFGRGQQLQVLSSQTGRWFDLALVPPGNGGKKTLFLYNPKTQTYDNAGSVPIGLTGKPKNQSASAE